MQNLRRKIFKSEFAINAIKLSIGTIVAQLIPILFYPIFSRIYSPNEFGIAANFSVILPILVILATGMYESAILICESNKEAISIIGLVITRSFIFLSIVEVGIILFGEKVCSYFNQKELSEWLFLLPIASFATIVTSLYSEWCIRNKSFNHLSKVKIINTSSIAASKLVFSLTKTIGNGLILGDVFGKFISSFTSIRSFICEQKTSLFAFSKSDFKILKKKYSNLPRFTMPDQLISNVGGSAPTILLGIYYSNTELGYFSVAGTLLTVPITVFTISIRDVFRQKASEEFYLYGNCQKIYKQLFIIVITGGVIGFSLLYFFVPSLIDIFLGDNWTFVGKYAQLQMPMFFLSFVSMSLSGVLIITNKMKVSFYWQIYYTIVTLSGMAIGIIFFNSIEATIILLVISRCSAYILYMMLSYRYSKGIMK